MRPRALALLVLAAGLAGPVVVAVDLALLARPASGQALRLPGPAPEIAGERWINSEPLTLRALRGRVVLVEFWTYG
jgi:hypothetical protein